MGETAGLHIAVLTIGEAGAAPDDNMIVDRLRAAGHTIVSRASVDNFVPVVRRQLAAWVSDANIDVAIVVGGGDDNVASSALGPLVTQPLPGFADVFRMLMFQSLGSAAVLAHAEAARCTAKVVFLLPAMADGVALALDKLIIPQLDPKTEPYNVARLLPKRVGASSASPPTSSSQPGGSSPNKTTPPPFQPKKVVTPPIGIPSVPPGATPQGATTPKKDDPKVIVEELEPEPDDDATVSRRASPTAPPTPPAHAAPTSPIANISALVSGDTVPPPVGPAKRLADADKTFTIRAADSSPRVAMFAKPKRKGLHPIVKALVALALVAATAAIAIILWTRFELKTKTVSAGNNPPPGQGPDVGIVPTQPATPMTPTTPMTIEQPDASVAPAEIDVDPATTTNPAIAPQTPPARPHVPTTPPTHPQVSTNQNPPAETPTNSTPMQPSPPTGPLPADGCDEVSCVLDHYQRECCAPFKPKEPSKTPGVADDLDRASVYKAIETMKPVVITCGERFKAKGTVRVHLVVAPDGHVSNSSVESTPDAGLGSCVAEALRRVQFKRTNNGGELTYPYVF